MIAIYTYIYTAKMKYEYHTKLPLESYQNRFWYDSTVVVVLYDIHTSFFAYNYTIHTTYLA